MTLSCSTFAQGIFSSVIKLRYSVREPESRHRQRLVNKDIEFIVTLVVSSTNSGNENDRISRSEDVYPRIKSNYCDVRTVKVEDGPSVLNLSPQET